MKVPDLVGKSLHEARKQLRALKIKIGEIEFEERDNILPETILNQSLNPGDVFEEGDTIDLIVSRERINR